MRADASPVPDGGVSAAPAAAPRLNLEEWLKYRLIPAPLYIGWRARRELRRGEAEAALLPFLVDRARNAIDAGANKGVYTHLISRLARHTYAFEPNPKMFRLLRRYAGSGCTALPLALSDASGEAQLRIPYGRKGHSNQGASLSPAKVRANYTPIVVRTAAIDDLALPDIGFIKIDVEGFESAVIRGARATIARDRPAIQVEIEEAHTGRPIEQSFAEILELGYDGLFVGGGALRSLAAFDPERHHRTREAGYVFNFIFLPRR